MNKEEIHKIIQREKEEREKRLEEYWNNLKKFEKETDIPHLPIPLTAFHIEKLIKAGAIPKKDLVDGKTYCGKCRNAYEAVWHQDKNVFIYKRNKFGFIYDEDINHFEDDNGYDLFVPIGIIENMAT